MVTIKSQFTYLLWIGAPQTFLQQPSSSCGSVKRFICHNKSKTMRQQRWRKISKDEDLLLELFFLDKLLRAAIFHCELHLPLDIYFIRLSIYIFKRPLPPFSVFPVLKLHNVQKITGFFVSFVLNSREIWAYTCSWNF